MHEHFSKSAAFQRVDVNQKLFYFFFSDNLGEQTSCHQPLLLAHCDLLPSKVCFPHGALCLHDQKEARKCMCQGHRTWQRCPLEVAGATESQQVTEEIRVKLTQGKDGNPFGGLRVALTGGAPSWYPRGVGTLSD